MKVIYCFGGGVGRCVLWGGVGDCGCDVYCGYIVGCCGMVEFGMDWYVCNNWNFLFDWCFCSGFGCIDVDVSFCCVG